MTEAEIFVGALEKPTLADRDEFLSQVCGSNVQLRHRIAALLNAHEATDENLDRPAAEQFTNPAVSGTPSFHSGDLLSERVGTTIGLYKLLQQIGEGGFGVVYMAEQDKPVRRTVALKIVKPGMDTRQVIARFESERQALAIMDHPNIAKVLDAGATDTGRPYFVMELVKGIAITEFCDKNHMRAEDRLRLFIDVCHAIQHAHHKGIIHRDIKPSNILVTLHDGVPVVKIIDFGVAKAIGQKLTEKTLFTAFGQMLGTPMYMSPEQAEMSDLDIDTRTDIYSLGVLLYELLTGTTPLEAQELRAAGYARIQQMIRDDEPPKPSTRFSSLGDDATVLAGNRGTDPRHLARLLSGDLDWIVMKALEKNRNRRYPTPGNFAEDIERFLRHDEVVARPPSAAYRFQKFAQRHRGGVFAAATIAAALIVGTSIAIWQAVVATAAKRDALLAADQREQARAEEAEQRKRAQDNERKALAAWEAEKAAKLVADRNAAESRAVLDFVERNILAAARPAGERSGLGHSVTLRDALQAALPAIESRFAGQPLTEARVRMTMGFSFQMLGDAPVAVEQFKRAWAISSAQLGADHDDTLRAMLELANALSDQGKHDEAIALRERNFELQKAQRGPDHASTLASMSNLANSYERLGRLDDAIRVREEALPLMRKTLPPDSFDLLATMGNLANTYRKTDRFDESIRLFEETLSLCRAKLPAGHSLTLTTMSNLASAYAQFGRQSEALRLREEALAGRREKLGPHPETWSSMNNLSYSYRAVGRNEEALKLAEEALTKRRERFGPTNSATLISMQSVANCYAALGQTADAVQLLEEAIEILKRATGPTVPARLAEMKSALAWVWVTATDEKLRNPATAVALATQAVETTSKDANLRGILGAARYRAGDFPAAVADLEQAIRMRKADDFANAREGFFLAMAYHRLGKTQEAREWFGKSVAWLEKAKSPDAEFQRIRAEATALIGEPPGLSRRG